MSREMERKSSTKTAVVSGSVWETRMINDEIMGGFKVFNEKNPELDSSERKQRVPKQRKVWTSDNSIQIATKKSPNSKTKEINERSPVQIRKLKQKRSDLDYDNCGENEINKMKTRSQECERNPVEISDGIVKIEPNLVKKEVLDEIKKEFIGLERKTEELGVKEGGDEFIGKIEKNKSDLDEEEVVSSGLINVGFVKSVPKIDCLSLNNDNDKDKEEEIEVKLEKQSIQEIKLQEQKPKQIVNEEKKLNQNREEQLPIISSPVVKKQPPNLVNYSRTNQSQSKIKRVPDFERFQSQRDQHRTPQTHGKLQSLIDLVMWRDASKSTFVFGIGTFIIISSSYTKDLNISLVSVFAYLGLVYLAAIFIFRSIISREVVDEDGTSEEYVVGEEEAVWLIKMVIPYLNECLIKIKALFSGDPATTMKLAVLLFVLARTGSSITIWKMAKLGFFGVFTIPKICSSYSTQLTAYGKFWVRRFQDAWESCSHKKAVGFGIFTLVWNLSSVVARIWAVFMLFVAFRYYQQSITDDYGVEEKPTCEQTWQGQVTRGRRIRNVVTTPTKETKKF